MIHKSSLVAMAFAALMPLATPAHAEMFEDPLDCVKPRLKLVRGLCADPQLRDLARETRASFEKAQTRLKAHPALLASLRAINADLVSSLDVSFDQPELNPQLALARHKAILDAVQPTAGKGIVGAWSGVGADIRITGGDRLSATMRSQGFGQNSYDCSWKTRIRPIKGGWETDRRMKGEDEGIFYVRMNRQEGGLELVAPQQSERAPDDCPPWASFAGLFVPVSSRAGIERMPGWIVKAEGAKGEAPKTIKEFLLLLPGQPFPEHAPDLTRAILFDLLAEKPVEGWGLSQPKPDVLVIARSSGAERIAFQFADPDRTSMEMIAFHNARWHLAEWHLRADKAHINFAVPSLTRAVQRLFLTSRGDFLNGAPRDGVEANVLPDDMRIHFNRMSACAYFGETRKAGPRLPQKEIDDKRASNKCAELAKSEADIRDKRGKYPDVLRMLDLANQLVSE